MDEWDIYRAVFAHQPDRATQERVIVAFQEEARGMNCDIAHERCYDEDGNWHGEVFIVGTRHVIDRLSLWREVKRIKPAK